MKRCVCCLGLALLTAHAAASGETFDWPQWQGPQRIAVSQEKGLLREWPSDGPPLAWKIEGLGGGYSAPAVAAGRIFGMSHRQGDEIVWALSETDGQELWARRLGPAVTDGPPQGKEGPGCTPAVDGERLYVLGSAGDLACLQVSDGRILWRRSLINDLGGSAPRWRYNESPLVDGDKLICTPGGPDSAVVALDKLTGETIWKCQVPTASPSAATPPASEARPQSRGRRGGRGPNSLAAYASAIAIDVDGEREYVQLTSTALIGISAADGKLLWRYERAATRNGINCSTPVYHDGVVVAASAYGNGAGAVRLKTEANGAVTAEEVYFSSSMQNHHGGMIMFDDCLYGAAGGNEGGFLVCLDFRTGQVLWRERRAPKGSLAFADSRLYLRTESGEMILIEPNRKGYVERGRFNPPDRSTAPAWSHPVIANGKLYLRDQDGLLCYDVKGKG